MNFVIDCCSPKMAYELVEALSKEYPRLKFSRSNPETTVEVELVPLKTLDSIVAFARGYISAATNRLD